MHRSIRGKGMLLMGYHRQCLHGWVCYRDHLFFFSLMIHVWEGFDLAIRLRRRENA